MISLPDGLNWVMRPWLSKNCDYNSLKDGTIDLVDLALMNEALDVLDENNYRLNQRGK